jgi:type IV pilus assembly protein PilB
MEHERNPILSSEQERQAAAATVERLTSTGMSFDAAAAVARKVLGDVLVDLGFCDRDTVEAAALAVHDTGMPIGQVLHEQYQLPDSQLAIAIGERFGMRYQSLEDIEPDVEALELVPIAVLLRLDAVPVGFTEVGEVLVVLDDPRNQAALDELATLTGRRISAAVVTRADLDELLHRAEQIETSHQEPAATSREPAHEWTVISSGEGPAAEFASSLIAEAFARGDVSDDGLTVHYRVDVRISIVPIDAP